MSLVGQTVFQRDCSYGFRFRCGRILGQQVQHISLEGHLIFKWNRFYQMAADLDRRLDEFELNDGDVP